MNETPEWKDTTSYSQEDKERKQTAWTAESGPVRITVTNGHIHHKPNWVMHCYAMGIDTKPLKGCESPEDAQREAVAVVLSRAAEISTHATHLLFDLTDLSKECER